MHLKRCVHWSLGIVLMGVYGWAARAESLKKAPDFTARDLNGKSVTLSSLYKEGPVIVDFWATWCAPCMAEMKELAKIHEKYKARGLTVVAISVDGVTDAAKVRQCVKGAKLPFIVVIDRNQQLKEQFSASTVPTLLLIGKDGVIHAVHNGYLRGDEKKLEKEIEEILARK